MSDPPPNPWNRHKNKKLPPNAPPQPPKTQGQRQEVKAPSTVSATAIPAPTTQTPWANVRTQSIPSTSASAGTPPQPKGQPEVMKPLTVNVSPTPQNPWTARSKGEGDKRSEFPSLGKSSSISPQQVQPSPPLSSPSRKTTAKSPTSPNSSAMAKLKIGAGAERPLKSKIRTVLDNSTKITVKANHFEVKVDPKKFPEFIYHYDVVIKSEEKEGSVAKNPDKENTLPDRILPIIWEKFEQKYAHLLKTATPFDGKKNAYAPKQLLFSGQTGFSTVMEMKDPDDPDKQRKFVVTIKEVAKVPTAGFWEFLRSGTSGLRVELPQDIIQALDVALRYAPTQHFISCNRSYFSTQDPIPLTDLLQLLRGHYQSLCLGCENKAYVNIDLATKAFYMPMPLDEYIQRNFGCKPGSFFDMNISEWNEEHFEEANASLRGKLIEYGTGKKDANGNYEQYHRFTAVGLINETADSYKFTIKEGQPKISIVQYMKDHKNTDIKYTNYPVVHIGSKNKTNYVPLELCRIIPQAYRGKMEPTLTAAMIKGAAIPPKLRFENIQRSRNNCKYEACKVLAEFGIGVGKDMQIIDEARRIHAPKIKTRINNTDDIKTYVHPTEGKWSFKEHREYLKPANVPKFGVLDCAGTHPNAIQSFLNQLASQGKQLGMTNFEEMKARVQIVKNPTRFDRNPNQFCNDIRQKLGDMKKQGVKLVIVVMTRDGKEYASVKAEAEVQVGILTACIKQGNVMNVKPQTLTNYLLKMNAKLSGTNFEVEDLVKTFLGTPTLIIGADVTHPSPNSKAPSIAAVTASFNLCGMGYKMHIQPQASRQEVIDHYGEIIEKFIKHFAENNEGILPKQLVIFRDGVSEGYFDEIKVKEYEEIRKVCERMNPQCPIKITFVVVKKRHHTRFQLTNEREGVGKYANVPPGTVVDTNIVHPSEQEFFLNSHVGIQGTSKPTRYHVIHNDCNFSLGDIMRLTYFLCYTFVRCNQPVSYPAPTYYAHLAAFRARCLIENEGENASLEKLQEKLTIHPELMKEFPMFFV